MLARNLAAAFIGEIIPCCVIIEKRPYEFLNQVFYVYRPITDGVVACVG